MAGAVEAVPAEGVKMKYLVLRNCFTKECRYFRKGETVELPDEMKKPEKNFKLLEQPADIVVGDTPGLELSATGVVETVVPVQEISVEEPEPPVIHQKVKGKKECTCGKVYKTNFYLNRHLNANKPEEA